MESSTSTSDEKLNESIAALEHPISDDIMHENLSCYYCEGWPCTCLNTVGTCSCPPNAAPSPSCVFYSPRILILVGYKTEFQTARDDWTEVDAEIVAEVERIGEENRKYFDEVLVKHPEWGEFFRRFKDLEVGAKIGEGGQAEIFGASSQSFEHPKYDQLVAKVWKEGVPLRDLERQWPPQMLLKVAQGLEEWPFQSISGGVFIRSGGLKNRFAIVMARGWGDLRAAIDQRMLELAQNGNHGPPFNNIKHMLELLKDASLDLWKMHVAGVLHRDIKASNVLLARRNFTRSIVIDY